MKTKNKEKQHRGSFRSDAQIQRQGAIVFAAIVLLALVEPKGQSDLNRDGIPDSISLAADSQCGNAGCFYKLKISNGIGLEFDTTTQFFHERAISIRQKKKGVNRIKCYIRENADSGYLIEVELKSNQAKEIKRTKFNPYGKDSALYKKLFLAQ